MSTIQDLFRQAQLAEAAYAKFFDNAGNLLTTNAAVITALQIEGFSESQATAFLQNWRVISQFTESGLLSNGFSATLFERLDANQQPTGQYTLGIAGSTQFVDFAGAVLDLAVTGVALNQLVSMVNYVLRLKAGANGFTQQLTPIGRGLTSNVVSGVGPGINPAQLTVSGHSLGGYLSQVYQRIFGSAGVYTYNSLGLVNPNASIFDRVTDLLGLPPGSYSSGPGENLLVPGEPAHLIGTVQGKAQIRVFSEAQSTATDPVNTIAAHRVSSLTGSLAVYDLFAKIDPALNSTDPTVGIGRITDILKAASNKPAFSLETALDSMRKLFKDPAALNPAPTATDKREQFYQNLYVAGFQQRIASYAGQLSISRLTDISVTDLSNLALGSSAFAFRYALKELNPFAVVGNNTLYDGHNQTGDLNLYDPAAAVRAGMTTRYIADRAQMLVFSNIANTNDANAFGSNQVADQVRYTDLGKVAVGNGGDFVVFPPGGIANFNGPNTRRVTFGTDSTDSLVGRDNTDRLYGGGGTDVLSGNGGDDYLEGGSGLDLYNYNAFSGLLSGNDGADVIQDTDGKGVLRYVSRDGTFASPQATVIADASARVSGTQWNSADGRFTYIRSQDDLLITVNTPAGGSLTLKNFKDGDFGIRLWEARPTPQTASTISGDLKPQDFDPATPGVQTRIDGLGNVIVTAEVEVDRGDFLFGNRPDASVDATAPGEKIDAGGGNDIIFSDRPNGQADNGLGNADWIIAGAGRDLIEAGAGNDLIEAGADGADGGDIADAGTGDDELYAEGKGALNIAILAGNNDVPTAIKGDLLSGAAGRDWIVGGRAKDLLLGGDGEDLIIGGAGDDDLWGDLNLTSYALSWQVTRSETINNGVKVFEETFAQIGTSSGAAGGADVIYGGRGRDWIFGGAGDDFLDAGADDDVAMGEAGADILIGGAGNDVLAGDNPATVAAADEGGDYLDGGAGNDELFGQGGDDVLIGDSGDDVLLGGDGRDILIGGAGTDILLGGSGKDTYVFNRGDGTEVIVDTPTGANDPEASVLVLGEGITRSDIKFRKGSLLLDLGQGDAIHFEGFNPDDPLSTPLLDSIQFADGASMSYQDVLDQGFDLDGTEGDDLIEGTAVVDRIDAKGGNDKIIAKAGNDAILGGEGDDDIDAGAGDDILTGGVGNDRLVGNDGSDTYHFARGDGQDTIVENGDPISLDVLEFAEGIAAGELDFERRANGDLIVRLSGTDDQVTLEGHYAQSKNRIERIQFADGSFISAADLASLEVPPIVGTDAADDLLGTPYADTILGLAGDDTLDGGSGADQLQGGEGQDTYLFTQGMGQDTLVDTEGANVIRLADGIPLGAIDVRRSGDDLTVDRQGTGDGMRVTGYFNAPENWAIEDSAGEAANIADLLVATQERDANEYLSLKNSYESSYRTVFNAEFQSQGYQLNPNGTLSRRSETPALASFVEGTQTITTVITYLFVPWNPTTQVQIFNMNSWDYEQSSSVRDSTATLSKVSIVSDAAFIDGAFQPAFQSSSNFVWATIAWEETSPRSPHTFSGNGGGFITGPIDPLTGEPSYVRIVDSASVQNYTTGTAQSHIVQLHPGQSFPFPHFTTLFPNKTFLSWTQESTLCGYSEVQAGPSDNVISGSLFVDAGAGNDTVSGAAVAFGGEGDDQLYGSSVLLGGTGNDHLEGAALMRGGPGDDQLYNGAILVGGPGNDTLDGSYGETRYLIDPAESGIDLIRDSGESQDAFLDGYYSSLGIFDWRGLQYRTQPEYFVIEVGGFATLDDASAALAQLFGVTWDEAVADGFASVLEPLPPAPQIAANDYAGLAPYYESGMIEFDRVEFGEGLTLGDLALVARHRTVVDGSDIVGPDETLEITWGEGRGVVIQLPRAHDLLGTGIEQVQFTDGSVLTTGELISLADHINEIRGSAGDDVITGTDAAEVIQGGPGNDLLDGGLGDDIYVFNPGDGVDTITDAGSFDRIFFGPGIIPEMLSLGLGSFLIRIGDSGDALHLETFDPQNVLGVHGVELFRFDDGTTLSYLQLIGRGFDLFGTAGEDVITGTNVTDRMRGGAGNDVLEGGQGSDRYLYALGDGSDTLIERLDDSGATDALVLEGLVPQDITVARRGEDLILSVPGAGAITIVSGAASGAIEAVEFADGTVWDAATLLAQAESPNRPPQVATSLADQSALEDAAFAFSVSDTAFSDPGDTLAYSAALNNGAVLPRWLSFDAASRSFSGTPTNDDVGAFEVTVTANDAGGLTASDTFRLAVANSNDAPELVQPVADRSAQAAAPFAFTVPEGTFRDQDAGDGLRFSATLAGGAALPGWLAFDAATRAFSGTPRNADAGVLSVRVTATDDRGASAFDTFDIAIGSAPQGVVREGSDDDDELVGTQFGDILLGRRGNDWLIGLGGDDLLEGDRGSDSLWGGDGDDLLDGGAGQDRLQGESGDDVLAGGGGSDQLEGGPGDDIYVYEREDGHDLVRETGGRDVLRFGEGITAGMVKLYRSRDDLLVGLWDGAGSVTIEGWFASDAKKVERIEFAEGAVWDAQDIRNHLQRAAPPKLQFDNDDQGGGRDRHEERDGHRGRSGRGHDEDKTDHDSRSERDRMAELLEVYLARKFHNDFEAPTRELERSERHGEALNAHEIARRWQVVGRYAGALVNEHDEDARGGAGYGVNDHSLPGGGVSGGGFGYSGSTGAPHRVANLQALQGLAEGFQRLHS